MYANLERFPDSEISKFPGEISKKFQNLKTFCERGGIHTAGIEFTPFRPPSSLLSAAGGAAAHGGAALEWAALEWADCGTGVRRGVFGVGPRDWIIEAGNLNPGTCLEGSACHRPEGTERAARGRSGAPATWAWHKVWGIRTEGCWTSRTGFSRWALARATRFCGPGAGHLTIATSGRHGTLVAQLTQQFTAFGRTRQHYRSLNCPVFMRSSLVSCCGSYVSWGLKIQWWQHRVGSSPTSGTTP